MKENIYRITACGATALAFGIALVSCGTDNGFPEWDMPGMGMEVGGGTLGGGSAANDGDTPEFEYTITPYAGERADDASLDLPGTNEDLYWEANDFTETVTVGFAGSTATVSATTADILCHTDGAYVTIDLQTNAVKGAEIIVSGKSDDGQLKIYGSKKFKLTLAGVELTCTRGPAINDQCKKRAFVHLADGTTNRLADAAEYKDEPYYLNTATAADEDRKGCFFSEGNLVFSGTGVLEATGNYRHGIVTDGCFVMRPGVTLVVTDAQKNAVHAKGDEDDATGVLVMGGLLYANTSATAGKAVKTDLHADLRGGRLLLSTSGGSEYDADEADTSSPACIKTDGDVTISGGTLAMTSTGAGGKGINADGTLLISGGATTISTSGGKYIYNEARDLTASPKGAKADGDVTITGGTLDISVTGASDGSEGLESKGALTVSGGEVRVYAYEDGINASRSITFSGGKTYAYSVANDGIDSNGTLTITGGLVIGAGGSSPEAGIDCDNSNNFRIDGGTVIGLGGTLQSSPSSSSKQRSVVYGGLSASKGALVCLADAKGTALLAFEAPRTLNGAAFLLSVPALSASDTYTLSSGGKLTGYTNSWTVWYEGGAWTDGTTLTSFTPSSVVTTLGTGGGMSGGGSGGFGPGGGWPGGR